MLVTISIGIAPGSPATGASGTMATGWRETSFKDIPSDAGLGSFVIDNDDPQLGDFALGRYARFYIDGTHRFTSRIERISPTDVDDAEEAGQSSKLEGRTLVSEWEDATVAPENGMGRKPYSTTRIFGFANPYFDDSTWDPAYEQFQQDLTDAPPVALFGLPEDWPDPFDMWIWSQAYTGDEVDPATSYFRKTFTLADGALYRLVVAGDNRFKFYVDGIEALSYLGGGNDGWNRLADLDVEMSAGEHVLAAVVENVPGPANLAGLLAGLWVNGGTEGLGTHEVTTDDSWVMVHDPAVAPGFTIDAVIQILLDEAQAQGFLPGWTVTTHGTFPELAEIPVQVGDDYLKVLKGFAEAHIDFDTAIDAKVLHIWPKGDRSTASGVAFDLGDNVLELEHDQQDTIKNVAHVLYAGGHLLAEDIATRDGQTSIERYGRREAYLSLENFETIDAVNLYLEPWFEVNAWPRYAVTLGIDPTTGDVPYVDFDKTDTVLADGEELGVASIAATSDSVGDAEWTLEVSSRAQLVEAKLDRQLKAKAAGTVGGRSLTASPTRSGITGAERKQQTSTKRIESYSWSGAVTADRSGSPAVDRPVRVTGLILSSHGDGTGDTTVELLVNGSSEGSCTLGASDMEVRESFIVDVVAGDVVEVECTTAGEHTGVVATPKAYYV